MFIWYSPKNNNFKFTNTDPRHRGLDHYRVTVGSAFNLKNRNAVDVFFRVQQEVNTANPQTAYILGLGYTYDLKLPKGKKKKKDKEKDKTKGWTLLSKLMRQRFLHLSRVPVAM